jgi:hypothetical protein
MESFECKTNNREARDEGDLEQLRETLTELCSKGPYSESLEILDDGTIGFERRATDNSPPLLPNLLASELGNRDVETFYRLARDIQRKLPEFEFSISENPERTNFTYRIARRGG